MKNNLILYASRFVSYFLGEIGDLSNLKNVVLFGSVARGDAKKESDVDIFIELNKSDRLFEKRVDKIVEGFYKTREALLFKAGGTDNRINVVSGMISDWPKLREGIEGEGIVFYGKYISVNVDGKKNVIISWAKVGVNRGAFLNKLYGYKVGAQTYKGLIELLNGKKLGKSTIMIPIENRDDIFSLLKKYKVDAKMIEVYA